MVLQSTLWLTEKETMRAAAFVAAMITLFVVSDLALADKSKGKPTQNLQEMNQADSLKLQSLDNSSKLAPSGPKTTKHGGKVR